MEGRRSDPFKDPLQEQASMDSDIDDSSNDLYVEPNARLSLSEGGLVIYDQGLRRRRRDWCCGLLAKRSSGIERIPYNAILDASISADEISIIHALPTSKRSVRPSHVTYTLRTKVASSTSCSTRAWVSRLLSLSYGSALRQKRIKVLINPYGGKGTAPSIWAREAEPIFRSAGCKFDVTTTGYVNHAAEVAKELDVDAYDVIACVSGDGTTHEVFNGLSQQTRPRRALRKIAVVQVPAGSGNAMALNLCGTDSPSMAALAIVKGVRTPFDLISIRQGDKRIMSFLSQALGVVAECDLGTDHLRWMGSARFTLGFLVRVMGHITYPAEVAVKLEVEKDDIRQAYKKARYGRDENWAETMERDREAHDDEPLPESKYGTVDDPLPADWMSEDLPTLGNFYCGNMCYMSPDSPFFPAALPNDGLMDLTKMDGRSPFFTSVGVMLSIEKNELFDRPTVDYTKVSAYRITPRLRPDQKEGWISIDGERIEFAPFQAEVLPGIATVLSVPGKAYHWVGPPELKKQK